MANPNRIKFRDRDGLAVIFDFIERKVYLYSSIFQRAPQSTVAFEDIELKLIKDISLEEGPWTLAVVVKAFLKESERDQDPYRKKSVKEKLREWLKYKPDRLDNMGFHRIYCSAKKQKVVDIAQELAQKCHCSLFITEEK